ncbi:MAG: Hsp20/alpha crystallin family protein [Bacteroidia bacterium]|nr:Hsp20/alpha crystallin family protein [Bacteroidia bacterium]
MPTVRSKVFLPTWADDFFGKDFLSNFREWQTGVCTPAVNIIEGKEDFRIELAAPGLNKDDFRIDVDHRVLTISSEIEDEKKENDDNYMRREFSYKGFTRSFSLPESIDNEKITASQKDGILTLVIPNKEEAKDKGPRKIAIS